MSINLKEKRPRVAVTHDRGYKIAAYLRAVELAGGEAIPVTASDSPSMRQFDALVISGGVDVNPALYGETPHPETQPPDDERDRMEQALLQQALDAGKPVLAICRGFQLFNVAHGGTLQQHIDGHRGSPANKALPAHSVRVGAGSRLAKLLGGEEIPVNSRHHQAIGRLGTGLVPTAVSEDGIVEGLELSGSKFAVAIQWHPENMAESDPAQMGLFAGLIAAARAAES